MWPSPTGDAVIRADSFRDELDRFDHEFIEAMHTRVDHVAASWSRPEIRIDVDQLRRDQADRSRWFERAMSKAPAPRHSWDAVLAAILELEARIGSV